MKTVISLVFILISHISFSQDLRIGAGYNYLYSKQYDRLIQTYNFSRPYLTEKQPLLSHGVELNLSYLFRSKKHFVSGIAIDYSFFNSRAKNEFSDVKLDLNLFDIGYLLHYRNKEKLKGFYTELGLFASIGLLNKKMDGKPYVIDGIEARSIQAGVSLKANIGYSFELNKRLSIAPILGIHYSPYFWEGQSELVINQTNGLLEESYTWFLNFNLGLSIQFNLKKVN